MSLNDELTAIREAGDAKRDPDFTRVMYESTAALEATDILEHVAAVGTSAPAFVRPAVGGEDFRLRQALKTGPVILSFFRGRW